MSKLSVRLRSRAGRYLIIGVSVYLFELLVILVAQTLGAGSVAAVGISFWLGLLASFGLQKIVTFGDKRLHYRILLPQLAAFSLLVLFNFGFTLLLTRLLEDSLPAVWCRTIALAVTTIWNFYLYKTRIFTWKTSVKSTKRKPVALSKQVMKRYRKWRSRPRVKRLRKYASKPKTGRLFLYASFFVLLATTLLWSVLGSHLQQTNADQLINARLFDTGATFHGAALPYQHTFLIKWPLFYLVKVFGYTSAAFLWVTVLSVLGTVGALVYVLSRIERRPLVLGTLCLALASVLLLIPAQPYAGALLPVNMAMLATRNLEYVLYMMGLFYLVKAPDMRSRQFVGSVVLLSLLIASDRLFLSISLGGALLAVLAYSLRKQWKLANQTAGWAFATLIALFCAGFIINVINEAHLVNIVGNQGGPYGLAHGAKSVILGIIFAAGGLLTNFGANPAYDVTALRQIPHSLFDHLLGLSGPAYLINLLVLLFCLYAAGKLLSGTLNSSKSPEVPAVRQLPLMLVWSAIAAIGAFIVTRHYHPVDARYLTICLFALFIALAAWLRPRRVDAELAGVTSLVLGAAIIFGTFGAIQTYSDQKQALDNVEHRNEIIARTLANHHVKVLVGDYWRVLPVQDISPGRQQQVLPLENCTQPRTVLTSKAWRPDLRRTSFAYLLSFDKSLTDYPGCSLEDVAKTYGIPNSSALIDGSLAHPKEVLLFYDRGRHFPKTLSTSTQAAEAILPIALRDLPRTRCAGSTVMNIVAHQDDDLLFMSPDLLDAIDAGHCVRTVYLTAGDAGGNKPYWLAREQGSEAAYSEMIGSKAAWMDRSVQLPGGQFVTVATPRDNDRVSLVFMHLPDGNLDGQGFAASRHESLAKLESKRVGKLRAVDGQSTYTAAQLTDALVQLMQTYGPAEIRVQSDYIGEEYKDHSDHRTAGHFAVKAHDRYESRQPGPVPLAFYIGYPIHHLPPDISDEALVRKDAAFNAYAAFDISVCDSKHSCQQNPVYGIYLQRQYKNPY